MPATRTSLLTPEADGGMRLWLWIAALALPLLGLVLLLAAPDADVQWEHHPSHFWLVLAAGVTSAALAFSTSAVALRRSDARLYLVSLAFLSAAGFLGLHPLSTPPLDAPTPVERAGGALVAVAGAALVLYALAAARYLAMVLHSGSPILLGVTSAWVLLGEASVAVAFGRNWHASWWEWHLLMLVAFGAIGVVARREDAEERFSDLYLDHTAAGTREVSVLFADLAGFTSFSEGRQPREVTEMLNAYFEVAIPPLVREHGGEIDRLIGDAIMATWGTRGDQPDHAERAVNAAATLQMETARLAAEHPDWPRFRAAVNTGEARVGAYLLELRS